MRRQNIISHTIHHFQMICCLTQRQKKVAHITSKHRKHNADMIIEPNIATHKCVAIFCIKVTFLILQYLSCYSISISKEVECCLVL